MKITGVLFVVFFLIIALTACEEDGEFRSSNPQYYINSITLEGCLIDNSRVYLDWTDLVMDETDSYVVMCAADNDTAQYLGPYTAFVVDSDESYYIDDYPPYSQYIRYFVTALNVNGDMIYSNQILITREGIYNIPIDYYDIAFYNKSNSTIIFSHNNDSNNSLYLYNILTQEIIATQNFNTDNSDNTAFSNDPYIPEYILGFNRYYNLKNCNVFNVNNLVEEYSIENEEYIVGCAANKDFVFIFDYNFDVTVFNIHNGNMVNNPEYVGSFYNDRFYAAPGETNKVFNYNDYDDIINIIYFKDNGLLENTVHYNISGYFSYDTRFFFSPNGECFIFGDSWFDNSMNKHKMSSIGEINTATFNDNGTKAYFCQKYDGKIYELTIPDGDIEEVMDVNVSSVKDVFYNDQKLYAVFYKEGYKIITIDL